MRAGRQQGGVYGCLGSVRQESVEKETSSGPRPSGPKSVRASDAARTRASRGHAQNLFRHHGRDTELRCVSQGRRTGCTVHPTVLPGCASTAQSVSQEPVLLAEITCLQVSSRRAPSVRFERGSDRAGQCFKVTYIDDEMCIRENSFQSSDEQFTAIQVTQRAVEMCLTRSDDRMRGELLDKCTVKTRVL